MMKKLIMIIAVLGCALFAATSCDKDYSEDLWAGKMGDSFWVSYSGAKVPPYYTLKFSGSCHARLRQYVTKDVDIDIKQYYQVCDDGSYAIVNLCREDKNFLKEYARFRVVDDNTLELTIDGKTMPLYRQSN